MEIYKNLSLENLPGEEWKPVKGYEGIYEVSNMGRVRVIKKCGYKMRVQIKNHRGYLRLGLTKNRNTKIFSVHRLVGEVWLTNLNNLPQINHKRGIKTDNRATELEWTTQKENNKHKYTVLGHSGTKSFLGKLGALCPTSKPIIAIFPDGKEVRYPAISEAARILKLSLGNISSALHGTRKHTKGIRFREANTKF